MVGLNWLAPQAFKRVGDYWHVFPTYRQGRRIAWEGKDKSGEPFLKALPFPSKSNIPPPGSVWHRKRDDEMKLWLHGGSTYQVVGVDNIDNIVGAGPVGVIMSEYAVQDPAAWDLIEPMLEETGGFAIFPFTPRGRNHGYDLWRFAGRYPEVWFREKLTWRDTGVFTVEQIDRLRERLTKEIFEQEYECSFNASLVGAYYKDQLAWLDEQEPPRIHDHVDWVSSEPVFTGFDLGHYDSTAIWFAQEIAGEIRLIDYYEASGESVDHYAKVIHGKPYVHSNAHVPHDASHENMTGETVFGQMSQLGLKPIQVPKMAISDQHAMVRSMLRRCYIHETKCKRGLQALREYTKQPIENERGPGGETLYRDAPLHNWASHGAAALATLFAGYKPGMRAELKQPDASWVT